jgi:hypothetical protein
MRPGRAAAGRKGRRPAALRAFGQMPQGRHAGPWPARRRDFFERLRD